MSNHKFTNQHLLTVERANVLQSCSSDTQAPSWYISAVHLHSGFLFETVKTVKHLLGTSFKNEIATKYAHAREQ